MKSLHLWMLMLSLFIAISPNIITHSQTPHNNDIITPQNASDMVQQHIIGNGRVFDMVISPLADTFALASYVGIWIHPLANASASPLLLETDSAVYRVAYSPDGQFIASTDTEGILTVWHVASQTPIYRADGVSARNFAYSPDGQFIAITDYFGTLTMLQASTGAIISQTTMQSSILELVYHPNGTELAIASESDSRGIHIVDITNPANPVMAMQLTDIGSVYHIAYDRTGDLLVGYGHKQAVIWGKNDAGRRIVLQNIADPYIIWDIGFDNTSESIFIASEDGQLSIYDILTGDLLDALSHPQHIAKSTLAPDGTLYTLANGIVYAWDYAQRLLKQTYDKGYLGVPAGDVVFTPDMTQAIIANHYQIKLVDTATWQTTHLLQNDVAIYDIRAINDNRMIASGAGKAVLWDVSNQTVVTEFLLSQTSIAVNQTGDMVAIGTYDEGIWFIHPQSGEVIHTIPVLFDLSNHPRYVSSVVFSPDGLTLAGLMDRQIHLWDVARGELRQSFENTDTVWLAYHPSGNFLVGSTLDDTLVVWDANTGGEIRRFAGMTSDNFLSQRMGRLNHNGDVLAVVNDDIYLYDFDTGELLTTLSGHIDIVTNITFSPDGRHIASSSYDGTVRIWGVGE